MNFDGDPRHSFRFARVRLPGPALAGREASRGARRSGSPRGRTASPRSTKRVGPYRLGERLGHRPGLSATFAARRVDAEETVVVRLFASGLAEDRVFSRRLESAIATHASWDLPAVVPVRALEVPGGGLAVLADRLPGRPLSDVVPPGGIPIAGALGLLAPIATALDFAHEHGLVHPDLTPDNVIVDEEGGAALTDFYPQPETGGALWLRSGAEYLAREEVLGGAVTRSGNLYALTAILLFACSGRGPRDASSLPELLLDEVSGPPLIGGGSADRLTHELEQAVGLAMRSAQQDSETSAARLLRRIGDVAGVRVPDGPRARSRLVVPALPPEPAAGGARTGRALRIVLPLLGVGAAGVLGLLAGRSPRPASPARSVVAATSALRLQLPRGWRTGRATADARAFGLEAAVAAGPRRSSGPALLAGVYRAPDPSLLPAPAARAASGSLTAEPGRMGGLPAYRYADLALRGRHGRWTFLVIQTSAGGAAVACASGATASACETAARSLRLGESVRSLPLAPSRPYLASLAAVIRRLNAASAREVVALRAARTPADQLAAAEALASEYARAEEPLRSLRLPAPDARHNVAILAALNRIAADYGRLAAATSAGQDAGYAAARASVVADLLSLRGALGRADSASSAA